MDAPNRRTMKKSLAKAKEEERHHVLTMEDTEDENRSLVSAEKRLAKLLTPVKAKTKKRKLGR